MSSVSFSSLPATATGIPTPSGTAACKPGLVDPAPLDSNLRYPACSIGLLGGSVNGQGTQGSGQALSIMKSCCNDAPIYLYNGGCGLWCNAIGQSEQTLQNCLTPLTPGDTATSGSSICMGIANTTAPTSSTSSVSSTSSTPQASSSPSNAATALKDRPLSFGGGFVIGIVTLSFLLATTI